MERTCLLVLDNFIPILGVLQSTQKGLFAGMVELPQQGIFPVVPLLRGRGADVTNRQQIEIIQSHKAPHDLRKLPDHLGIADIPSLGGLGQIEMIFHQPGDQVAVVVAQIVQFAEPPGIIGAQSRMVAAAALGDIMK